MRKTRLIFWIISLVICSIIIMIYIKEENKTPYQDRIPINVYCNKQFQNDIKETIEDASIGDTHRVVFTENKDEAEFILTNEIHKSDKEYEKVGWSPLVIVFNDDVRFGYCVEDDYSYIMEFNKIIDLVIKGELKQKIYCPKLDTREGKLFFDFLLITINGGIYPNEAKLEKVTEKAEKFLNSEVVIQTEVAEKLKTTKNVKDEFYILFENEVCKNFSSNEYSFNIAYPKNTVVYEYYWKFTGENKDKLKETMTESPWYTSNNKMQSIFGDFKIRHDNQTYYNSNYYNVRQGFSYVEIPLKEED